MLPLSDFIIIFYKNIKILCHSFILDITFKYILCSKVNIIICTTNLKVNNYIVIII